MKQVIFSAITILVLAGCDKEDSTIVASEARDNGATAGEYNGKWRVIDYELISGNCNPLIDFETYYSAFLFNEDGTYTEYYGDESKDGAYTQTNDTLQLEGINMQPWPFLKFYSTFREVERVHEDTLQWLVNESDSFGTRFKTSVSTTEKRNGGEGCGMHTLRFTAVKVD